MGGGIRSGEEADCAEAYCGNKMMYPVSLTEFSDIFKVEDLHGCIRESRHRFTGAGLEVVGHV